MNVNAIKIDEEKCAVIDEQGNIKIISLNSNEQLEELLLKENHLENTMNEIEKYKNELKKNKNNSIHAEIRNAAIYTLDIILFIFGFSIIPLPVLLLLLFIGHVLLKHINITNYGTKISRGKQKYTLENKLKVLEEQIPVLEKQISKIKNNNKYITLNEIKALSKPQIISYENEFENITAIEEKPKALVKVHRKKNE